MRRDRHPDVRFGLGLNKTDVLECEVLCPVCLETRVIAFASVAYRLRNTGKLYAPDEGLTCGSCGQLGIDQEVFKEAKRKSVNLIGSKPLPLPEAPTDAWPGSVQKLLVMRERASNDEAVFHPDDATIRWTQKEIERVA